MDQTSTSRKDELKTKAKTLLKQARYASPMNLYMMNAVIESNDSSVTDLEELVKLLEEHNIKYEQNFTEYQKEVNLAFTEYFKSVKKPEDKTVVVGQADFQKSNP